MDISQDLRHNMQPINNLGTTNTTNIKRITLITLFIVQFLLPQLMLSYGIYAIFFVQQNTTILDSLWPPILYLATTKLSSPWLQVLSESLYEYNSRCLFFIGTTICSTGVALCYFFVHNILICGVFYGIFGGIGSTLITSLLNCYLYDIFQYQSHIVLGIHHLGIACGLFIMPIIIKVLIEFTSISYVFLIHGSILLHILPVGLLLGRKKFSRKQRLTATAYNNLGTNEMYEEEMVDMSHNEYNLSSISRNWKSPSDEIYQEAEYVTIDETDIVSPEKVSSPLPIHKTNTGVNILPQIIEEDEYETDDEVVAISKRSSMLLDDNLKRMSVISCQLEEIIQKEEETTILEIKPNEEKKNEVILTQIIDEPINISLSVDENLNRQNTKSCCTPYQKYRFRRRIKSCFGTIFKLFLKPLVKSIQIIEFYPALLTNVHSMLSPLIFLNFAVYRASSINTNEELNLTEISFMYPITAFAYLVFLITLPWITEISKRNLKYVYILGCIISASGTYMCAKNKSDDYLIISCLIYGLGFGIESYLKETVLKQFLGVSKWSRTENTLESLSGILLIVMILCLRNIFGTENKFNALHYSEQWLDVIFCNHLIVCSIWLVFPLINYLFDSLFYRNRGNYSFN